VSAASPVLAVFSPRFARCLRLAEMVNQYTLLTSVAVPQSSVPPDPTRTENTLTNASKTAVRDCSGIYSFRYTA
jgi:hypothetical protein